MEAVKADEASEPVGPGEEEQEIYTDVSRVYVSRLTGSQQGGQPGHQYAAVTQVRPIHVLRQTVLKQRVMGHVMVELPVVSVGTGKEINLLGGERGWRGRKRTGAEQSSPVPAIVVMNRKGLP